MGLYSRKGLYNGYDKKHKEREALDYYATPTDEVLNILEKLQINLDNKIILEPSCGNGHMVRAIQTYCANHNYIPKELYCTDIQDRGCPNSQCGKEYDFLSDDYPYEKADIIIMNPPFSCLEGFLIRALEIAPIVITLSRTQALEGQSRYSNVYKENPPTAIYQYIDRIQCWKNGIKPTGTSAQAYSWIVWDKLANQNYTTFNWIHRI